MHSVDFTSVEDVVASQTIACLTLAKWPAVRCVSKRAAKVLQFVWYWVRSQPRDIFLRNTRCTFCGWFTKNMFPEPEWPDAELCVDCSNNAVCSTCMYVAINGSIYCAECDAQPGIPKALLCMQRFLDHYDLYLKLDVFQCPRKRILYPVWKAWTSFQRL
jgi:hypothetical protein